MMSRGRNTSPRDGKYLHARNRFAVFAVEKYDRLVVFAEYPFIAPLGQRHQQRHHVLALVG